MELMENSRIRIAVADDHRLYRKGLIQLIESLGAEFEVVLEVGNGQELIDKLAQQDLPSLIILDLDMPVLNGYETALQLSQSYPDLPILVVSMHDDETALIRMLKAGVKGFLSKDVEPEELKQALLSISQKGYYYTDILTGKLILALHETTTPHSELNEREMHFLELCCTELTYKEMADKMCLSPKTIDGYRAALFEKLEAKSRVGLVLYAIKNRLVDLHS